ncbi:type I-E CRISPR-associated protein Cas6/Cse3/CasE [Rhodoferax sp. 4810]|nr:type I-E CRISPR-associated protein Cas6/Cse3/CasE [Rhodoferax jenense]
MTGYPIHRAVAALAQGAPHLWRDNGDTLTIRTATPLEAQGTALPEVVAGELRLFNLRACVGTKTRGRHVYPKQGDAKARLEWLNRQAQRHGFVVISAHCTSELARVSDQSGRDFMLDCTDFTGVLKVADCAAFNNALRVGVGATGKAFGFSLLSI